MCLLVFVCGFYAMIGTIATEKLSPRPSLKSFRDDYDSVAKTCLAVGYVKDNCKNIREKSKTYANICIYIKIRIHIHLAYMYQ